MKRDMKNNNNNNKGRGYYQGLYDRYIKAAGDASSSGDKILCEYNLQCAEHYMRVMNEKFPVVKNNNNVNNTKNNEGGGIENESTRQNDKTNTSNIESCSDGCKTEGKSTVDSVSHSEEPAPKPKRKPCVRRVKKSEPEKTGSDL